ncbi:head completion/stabilization protein [Candidatus Thiothrix sp. Deng01]|uniref:Head completion/stabilization protein n=1 Tax=Candidatus Thiothrix phosphatis TaxID=3112415 RepID=A0ABU6CX28_9GAMM|nr:head completion/stabilization protein [Candidatus Thiothrix sp. Deng01]MEB4591387.1 head completion/stabilization protein [Candidatus Thiothrix sp. Deng01]
MSDFSGFTPQKLDIAIGNNGFFPVLNLGDLQERHRIPSDYRQATVGAQTVAALIEVNRLLNPKLCEWQRGGYDALAAVPCAELGEPGAPDHLHELTELYKTAVFARAKAKLVRHYQSLNRSDRAARFQNKYPGMEWEDENVQDFMDESARAIAMILGDEPAAALRAAAV